jgi:hypothetical protein
MRETPKTDAAWSAFCIDETSESGDPWSLASDLERDRDFWKQQTMRVQDERAGSFAILNKAVGGTGLTEYQPEIDIAIECAILGIKQQRDRLAEALRRIKSELGVPQPEYPAPVANAVKIADEALAAMKGDKV